MRPGGLVLVIAGVWVGCQLFAGNALERLGVIPAAGSTHGTSKPAGRTTTGGGSTTALPA